MCKANGTELLGDLISALKGAHRFGQETDAPEGARYIQMSDTVVNMIIDALEIVMEELKK